MHGRERARLSRGGGSAAAASLTTLHSFTGGSSDGASSYAGLIFDATGNLDGTTVGGGSTANYGYGWGTVFQVTPPTTGGATWGETLLHSFAGGTSDGEQPAAGLTTGTAGNFYGTTVLGGANGDNGTVFELTPSTTTPGSYTETVLHSFAGSDGAYPAAGLIADASGNLYGTTAGGDGTVFQLAGAGFVVAKAFSGTPGTANCGGESISSAAHTYGGIAHAATSLGYASVADFQNAVATYCGG